MRQIVEARLKAGLTTVVDATLLTDRDRKQFVDIAASYNVPVQILIWDVPAEQLTTRDADRQFRVGAEVIQRQLERFERTSQYSYIVDDYFELEIAHLTVASSVELDFVGDIHGCYDQLIELIEKLGYVIGEDGIARYAGNEPRRLCFLGDYVDRGPKSLEVLKFIYRNTPTHWALLGNHDSNLLKGLLGKPVTSKATQETLHEVMVAKAEKWVTELLTSLPRYLTWRNVVICHADIQRLNLPQETTQCVYGCSKLNRPINADEIWSKTEKRLLIRGHFTPDHEYDNVITLDGNPGYGGTIKAGRFAVAQVAGRKHDNFLIQQWIEFSLGPTEDYEERKKTVIGFRLAAMPKELVSTATSPCGHLKLFKYTPNAFRQSFKSEGPWLEYPDLKYARGLVVGLNHQPVNTVFPKIPSYTEGIDPSKQVIAATKLNGFLLATFRHPYKEDVVFTTTGSFDSEYVKMGRALFYKHAKQSRQQLLNSPGLTFLWEVIDPNKDQNVHPIASSAGIYLIAVGQNGVILPEEEMQSYAGNLNVNCASHVQTDFGSVLEMARTSDGEGYMIRDLEGNYLAKLKSPFYLTVKKFMRLSPKAGAQLFNDPINFNFEYIWQQCMDNPYANDLYTRQTAIAEAIRTHFSCETWQQADSLTRREFLYRMLS